MGGGDLNVKKSWHPNTIKNQERVWKAEQASLEEKKRILELQREREEERDRAELKEMVQRNFGADSGSTSENRLHWMYDKPDKQAQQEDYLLGKAIGRSEEGDASQSSIPTLSRRVVGSSMTTTGDDSQVDLARKLREDPLLLVKERERAARAALLNNPLQRKKLTELLRKEQEQKESKTKKKDKKKVKDLDNVLAAKLNALGGKKGLDLTSLLNSDDTSDSSSSAEKTKKKKKKKHDKKKSKKSKKKHQSSDSDVSDADFETNTKKKSKNDEISNKDVKQGSRKRQSYDSSDIEVEIKKKKSTKDLDRMRNQSESEALCSRKKEKSYYENERNHRKYETKERRENIDNESYKRDRQYKLSPTRKDNQSRGSPVRRDYHRDGSPESSQKIPQRKSIASPKKYNEDRKTKRQGLSENEKAARLAEMAAAGKEREVERGHRVARQRAEDSTALNKQHPSQAMRNEARVLPDSLESRIHSNRHYIQRDRRHMNENFARR